jgi:hypothetical protein
VYNSFGFREDHVKRTLLVAALFSLTRLIHADDLEDSYSKLKDAVAQKNADVVRSEAPNTRKLAEALVTAPKPEAADQQKDWQDRVDYGKDVVNYSEYAQAITAAQITDPAKTIELVEALIAANPKSKYLDDCASAYLVALGKNGGASKQLAGMTKIVNGRPENEVALQALTEGLANSSPDRALNYAGKLVAVLSKKGKPEGMAEADWERLRTTGLASGYYISGAIYGGRQAWMDCDRNMKAALPLIKDNTRLGVIYFYLGLANYQVAKMTLDKPRMQQALQYSQKAASIPGPMRDQASHNVLAIQNELQGRK